MIRVALRKLTELVRTGAKPVLSANDFENKRNAFYRYSDTGDIAVVTFGDPGTVPKPMAAAEIGIGYSPRYHLEFLKDRGNEEIYVPHWTEAMFYWRLVPPEVASYAPERGQPWSEWWMLGDRTSQSAELLASMLADEVIPELTALESLDAQCAVIADSTGKIHVGPLSWGPVFVRLGRVPRAEVEAAIDAIPYEPMLAEFDPGFRSWARRKLDELEGA